MGVASEWAQTMARITFVEKTEQGTYDWALEYDASASTAVNAAGQPIKGPIQQHVLDKHRPRVPQTLKIRYLKEEPVIFEYMENIQYCDEKK